MSDDSKVFSVFLGLLAFAFLSMCCLSSVFTGVRGGGGTEPTSTPYIFQSQDTHNEVASNNDIRILSHDVECESSGVCLVGDAFSGMILGVVIFILSILFILFVLSSSKSR